MKKKRVFVKTGKTAIQEFADWLALKRGGTYAIKSSKKVIVFERI